MDEASNQSKLTNETNDANNTDENNYSDIHRSTKLSFQTNNAVTTDDNLEGKIKYLNELDNKNLNNFVNDKYVNFSNQDYKINSDFANGPAQLRMGHYENVLKVQMEMISRLESEIAGLLRIQKDQASQLRAIAEENAILENKLIESHKTFMNLTTMSKNKGSGKSFFFDSNPNIRAATKITPIDNGGFLRLLFLNREDFIEEMLSEIQKVDEKMIRGFIGQRLVEQTQTFIEFQKFFNSLIDSNGNNMNFVPIFENGVKTLIRCKKCVLWLIVDSDKTAYSRTTTMLVRESEGLVGFCMKEKGKVILDNPQNHPEFSPHFDDVILKGAENVLLQPVKLGENIRWIIEIIDILSESGSVAPPSPETLVFVHYIAEFLSKLEKINDDTNDFCKKLLDSSVGNDNAIDDILNVMKTYKKTILSKIGCQRISVYFVDKNKHDFVILDDVTDVKHTLSIDNAGIAGCCYKNKSVINLRIAKESKYFNIEQDGEYQNGSIIAVPCFNSKREVTVVTVARQKMTGIVFSEYDELLLLALCNLAHGSLVNSERAKQNLNQIKETLNTHKYYSTLLSIAMEFSSVLDIELLIKKIILKAQQFINADRCSLYLVDENKDCLWTVVAHGADDKIFLKIGEGIAGTVANEGKIINIPDCYSDPRFNPAHDKATGYITKSMLCVPIRNREQKIIGVTQMINKNNGDPFNDIDVELMCAFNVFCGIAITNATLYQRATKEKTKMTSLLKITSSISSTLSVTDMINNIYKYSNDIMQSEHILIYTLDSTSNSFKLLGSIGQNIPDLMHDDIVNFVASTGNKINSANIRNDERFTTTHLDTLKINAKSILVLPIYDASNNIFGVIQAINKTTDDRFDEADEKMLHEISRFAVLSLVKYKNIRPGEHIDACMFVDDILTEEELSSSSVPNSLDLDNQLKSSIQTHEFDSQRYTTNEHFNIIIFIFSKLGILEEYNIKIVKLINLLKNVHKTCYSAIHYNFNNSVDSLQILYYILTTSRLERKFTKLEILALLLSNLLFNCGKVSSSNDLKQLKYLYKDENFNEIHMLSISAKILHDKDSNITECLDSGQLKLLWTMIKECVYVNQTNFYTLVPIKSYFDSKKQLQVTNDYDKSIIRKLVFMISRSSYMTRPFDLAKKWIESKIKAEVGDVQDFKKIVAERRKLLDLKKFFLLVESTCPYLAPVILFAKKTDMDWENYLGETE